MSRATATAGRARAMEDALDAGRRLRAAGVHGAGDRHLAALRDATNAADAARCRSDERAIREAAGRRRRAGQRTPCGRRSAPFEAAEPMFAWRRDRLSFARDGADWPHREASRFVEAGGLRWHVQRMGKGPDCCCSTAPAPRPIPGVRLAPLLARRFHRHRARSAGSRLHERQVGARSIAAGDGARGARRCSTRSTAARRSSSGIRRARRFSPGSASTGTITPKLFVSLNGALLALRGHGRPCFSRRSPSSCFSIRLRRASSPGRPTEPAVANLLRGTGSKIGRRGVELYAAAPAQSGPCRRRAGHDGELGPDRSARGNCLA